MNKGLKALEELSDLASCGDLQFQERHNVFRRSAGVEKYKPIIEKELRALETIKEKRVNVGNFIFWLKRKPRTYEDYLKDFYQERWYLHYKDNDDDRCKFHKLTQEEYDSLKEVLS